MRIQLQLPRRDICTRTLAAERGTRNEAQATTRMKIEISNKADNEPEPGAETKAEHWKPVLFSMPFCCCCCGGASFSNGKSDFGRCYERRRRIKERVTEKERQIHPHSLYPRLFLLCSSILIKLRVTSLSQLSPSRPTSPTDPPYQQHNDRKFRSAALSRISFF